MRTKSFPARSRLRSSRRLNEPSPSSASLPADANEKLGSRESDKLIAHSDLQCDSGDTDVDIVRNTFDEECAPHKKPHCLDTSEMGRGFEPLNLDACIVCEIADQWVSCCSGINCLVSFHGGCLNDVLGTEDPGNSLCPYCWFNNEAHRSKSLGEKVVAAEKMIFKYLDEELKNSDKVKETFPETQETTTLSDDENKHPEHSVGITFILTDQELQRLKDACSSQEKQNQVEKDSDKSSGESKETNQSKEKKGALKIYAKKSGNMVVDEAEASENEVRVNSENFEDAEDDTDDETAKDKTKVNASAGKEHDGVQQIGKRTRLMKFNAVYRETSSNGSTNDHSQDVTEHKISSSAQVTSSSDQKGKDNTTTEVNKGKTARDISLLKKDMRRKLFWTVEEEEMLKVGVEKFSAEAKKNMPWRKILEMGKNVFHETRTPSDLKDKWRNMTGARFQTNASKSAH